jgi:hypothetical protein
MKTDNFVELAGVKGTGNKALETEAHQKTRLAKEQKDLGIFGKIMGAGLVLSLGMLGLTSLAITSKKELPCWMKKEFHVPFPDVKFAETGIQWAWHKAPHTFETLFTLPEGDYRKVKDAPLYIFWALSAYAGLLLASRDIVELTENIAKTVWFGFAFMLAPRLIEPYLERLFTGMLVPKAGANTAQRWVAKKGMTVFGSAENATYIGKLAVGSVLYAGMPTVMNRVFRHSRAEKAGLIPTQNKPQAPKPLASTVANDASSVLQPVQQSLIMMRTLSYSRGIASV